MAHLMDKIMEMEDENGVWEVHTYRDTQTFGRYATLEAADEIQEEAVRRMKQQLPPEKWENIFITNITTGEIDSWISPNDR